MFNVNILNNVVNRTMFSREIDHSRTSKIVSIIHFLKAELYSNRHSLKNNEEFLLKEETGRGSFSVVYRAKRLSDEIEVCE